MSKGGNGFITYIKETNLKPIHLLATHGHLDHNFGNGFIEDEFSLRPAIHEDDS
ncbi:MAG: MBL fold metallo-hydrolase, partial [Bacilli bacterium]|nr:MBL fold metallo-hydrolase [Bacilli bacterium]